MKTTQPERSS